MDGSSKRVKGTDQAGYGGLLGEGDEQYFALHMPLGERHPNSRAELRAILHTAHETKRSQHLLVVMNSEWAFKGLTEWFEIGRLGHHIPPNFVF